MITLYGIDENGNSVYTYNGETNQLPEHLKIAKNILNHQPHIHYVAIILETIETHPGLRSVSFKTQLLHLVCKSSETITTELD